MSRSLSPWQALILGSAVLVGLSLATLGLFAVGNRQWLWTDTFHLRVGFRQIHGVERTKERLVTLIKNAVPDYAPLVAAKVDEALKEALEDRKLQGLEKDGPIFVTLNCCEHGR